MEEILETIFKVNSIPTVLLKDSDPKTKNFKGSTPLHTALEEGHLELAQSLLKDSDPKAQDNWGNTPLHIALRQGHLELAQSLLKDSDPKAKDYKGRTPLHIALEEGHLELAQSLLKNSDFKAKDSKGRTYLHIAVRKGHLEILQSLLKYSDPKAKDFKRRTSLQIASNKATHFLKEFGYKNSKLEKIVACLKNVPKESSKDQSSLKVKTYSIIFNNQKDSDPKAKDSKVRKPLHIALEDGQLEERIRNVAHYSQRAINQVMQGERMTPSITVEVPPDGDCGFTATEYALRIRDNAELAVAVTREGFINTVKRIRLELNKPLSIDVERQEKLEKLLIKVYEDAHIEFNLSEKQLKNWEDRFNCKNVWASDAHFELMSYMHKISFEFYVIDPKNNNQLVLRGDGIEGISFINTCNATKPIVVRLFHNTANIVNTAATDPNTHFDLLYFNPNDELKDRIRRLNYKITQDKELGLSEDKTMESPKSQTLLFDRYKETSKTELASSSSSKEKEVLITKEPTQRQKVESKII